MMRTQVRDRAGRPVSLFGIALLAAVLALLGTGCAEDGATGPQGPPGPLPPGVDQTPTLTLAVSQAANGTHLVAGERATVTVTLADQYGSALSTEDFSTLNLYMYGPQETTRTVTAVKLLNASTDRAARPHHYIDLKTNTDVQVKGNVLKYQLQPVSDEEPGTYTVSLYASMAADGLQQAFPLADVQIGTPTVETQIIDGENCGTCHKGAASGKFYFHHVDPGRSPTGSWSIDSVPVRTCKSCHNNEGYAAYTLPTDSSVRVPDQIVNRVHGVHRGEELENPLNNDPTNGIFKDYIHVVFPADLRNCTRCHADDRWKTSPSRLACGTCHDNVWFGDAGSMPATAEAHPGGPQADDSACSGCHPADSGGVKAVAEAHQIPAIAFKNLVELSMSPPANGKFYTAGETPNVAITIKDAASGAVIDPATIVEPANAQSVQPNEWRRANFFVSGPRTETVPALTTAAYVPDPAHYYANNDIRVRLDPALEDARITRSATAITYQLGDVAGLRAGTYTAFVEVMPSSPIGGWGLLNFQVGVEGEEAKVATNCTDCHGDSRMHGSYFAVQFNPDICKNCHDYLHQIPDQTSWTTRNWGFGAGPLARRIHGVHFGRYLDKPGEVHATVDYSEVIFPQDVRNCTKCHGDNPAWKQEPSRLACLACHDGDDAIAHADLMTDDPTPADPYSGDERETCEVCHGTGRDFAPDEVHNVWDPYAPPYPREP